MPPAVHLEPFTAADVDRLLGWIPDAEFLMLWSGPFFRAPLTREQLLEYAASAQADPPPRRIYKAVHTPTAEVFGHIELYNFDERNQSATLGKVLVGQPQGRGAGLGTQMVNAALEIAFVDLGLHRVDLRVFDFNTPAVRCYQKAGFQIEGHLRDFRKVGEEYWSSYLMAVLAPDWFQARS